MTLLQEISKEKETIRTLKSTLQSSQESNQLNAAKIVSLKSENDALSLQKAALTSTLSQTSSHLQDQHTRIASLSSRIVALEKTQNTRDSEFKSEKSEKLALKKSLLEYDAHITRIEEAYRDLEGECERLKRQ